MKQEKLLKLASQKPFIVHRFKKSQYVLRKQCQRLCNNGVLEMVEKDHDNMYFRTAEETLEEVCEAISERMQG